MGKFERLDQLLSENKGYLRTSDAVAAGVSKSTLAAYVRENGLERTAHGLYMSKEAWPDALYVLQVRYHTKRLSTYWEPRNVNPCAFLLRLKPAQMLRASPSRA